MDDIIDDRILDGDLSAPEIELVPASQGKRFGNYFIDRIVIKFVNSGLTIGAAVSISEEDPFGNLWTIFGLYFSLHFLYYFLLEYYLKGKTLGKSITKTRAVNQYGETPTAETILLRTLCRLIPFEAFSYFANDKPIGWHDRFSKTMVIDEQLSTYPRDIYD